MKSRRKTGDHDAQARLLAEGTLAAAQLVAASTKIQRIVAELKALPPVDPEGSGT